MELPTEYNIFWRELRGTLTAAGATLNQYVAAIERLKRIEGEHLGPGMGQTAYLNGNDPYQALKDYVGHVVLGSPAPFWLTSAEGK